MLPLQKMRVGVGWGVVRRRSPQSPEFPTLPPPLRPPPRGRRLELGPGVGDTTSTSTLWHTQRLPWRAQGSVPAHTHTVQRRAPCYSPANALPNRWRSQWCTRTRTVACTHAHVYPPQRTSSRTHTHTHTHGRRGSIRVDPECRPPGPDASWPRPAAGCAARTHAHTGPRAPSPLGGSAPRPPGSPAPRPGRGGRCAAGAVRRGGTGRGRRPGARRRRSRRSRSPEPAGPRPSCRPGIFQPGR